MTRRFTIARRWRIAAMLVLLSICYWLGHELWFASHLARGDSPEAAMAVLWMVGQHGLAFERWLVWGVALHALVGGIGAYRRDREAAIGSLLSLGLHAAWLLLGPGPGTLVLRHAIEAAGA